MPVLPRGEISRARAPNSALRPNRGHNCGQAVEEIVALEHIQVQGLMTVAPIVARSEEARPHFVALRNLRDELAAQFTRPTWQHLSMGMTDDFEIAISEGATLVRVGRAIFGQRPAP